MKIKYFFEDIWEFLRPSSSPIKLEEFREFLSDHSSFKNPWNIFYDESSFAACLEENNFQIIVLFSSFRGEGFSISVNRLILQYFIYVDLLDAPPEVRRCFRSMKPEIRSVEPCLKILLPWLVQLVAEEPHKLQELIDRFPYSPLHEPGPYDDARVKSWFFSDWSPGDGWKQAD